MNITFVILNDKNKLIIQDYLTLKLQSTLIQNHKLKFKSGMEIIKSWNSIIYQFHSGRRLY